MATDDPGAAVQSKPRLPLHTMAGFSLIERLAGIILANRFVWLVLLLAWATVAQISYWQVLYPRFDTFELLAHISVILELAVVCMAALIIGSYQQVQAAWARRFSKYKFSMLYWALAGILCIVLLYAIMIAPVLYFHRYPELVEHDLRVPLMLLQRYLLVLLTVLFAYNLGLIFRLYFRFPWWLSAIAVVLCHVGAGYWVSWLSYTNEVYARLNDVFYYNMLAVRFEWFPALSQPVLFHNMELGFFNHYFSIAASVFGVSLLLWLPKAIAQSGNQK